MASDSGSRRATSGGACLRSHTAAISATISASIRSSEKRPFPITELFLYAMKRVRGGESAKTRQNLGVNEKDDEKQIECERMKADSSTDPSTLMPYISGEIWGIRALRSTNLLRGMTGSLFKSAQPSLFGFLEIDLSGSCVPLAVLNRLERRLARTANPVRHGCSNPSQKYTRLLPPRTFGTPAPRLGLRPGHLSF